MSLASVSFYILPLLVAFYFVKTYCSTAGKEDPNIATYEEVKNINSHPEKLLIDVREPEELKETGQIPFSINIPLRQLEAALTDSTSVKEFEKIYGRDFPDRDTPLIITCRSGARAQKGVDIAHKVGFTKLENVVKRQRMQPNNWDSKMSDLRRAFTLPDEYFVIQYGRKKPGLSAQLIFSCKTGRRAQQALDAVALLGYKNVKNYKGSWLDWAEREGLSK